MDDSDLEHTQNSQQSYRYECSVEILNGSGQPPCTTNQDRNTRHSHSQGYSADLHNGADQSPCTINPNRNTHQSQCRQPNVIVRDDGTSCTTDQEEHYCDTISESDKQLPCRTNQDSNCTIDTMECNKQPPCTTIQCQDFTVNLSENSKQISRLGNPNSDYTDDISNDTKGTNQTPCSIISTNCDTDVGNATSNCLQKVTLIPINEENVNKCTEPLLQTDHSLCQDKPDQKKSTDEQTDSTRSMVRFDGIILDVLNSTTIHVDWCPVQNNEAVCGYKIRYAARDISSYNEIFVTPGISSYTITGLRPNTEYDISVNAVDDRDNILQTCGWVRQKTDELEEGRGKKYEAPYLTAAAAIALLLVAVVVPITFLFVRNCGQCTPPNHDENTELKSTKNSLELPSSFRHGNDVIVHSTGTEYKTRTIDQGDQKRKLFMLNDVVV